MESTLKTDLGTKSRDHTVATVKGTGSRELRLRDSLLEVLTLEIAGLLEGRNSGLTRLLDGDGRLALDKETEQ